MLGKDTFMDAMFGEDGNAHHGRQSNQKLKPYVVLQYLMKASDADHVLSATAITEYLKEECGIYAERRSIYEDVKAINRVSLMLEQECTMDEAIAMLDVDGEDDLKLIVYDKHRKGFYVHQRHYDLNDIRLLAECVYSAKFVTEGQAKRLVNVCCDFVSEYQADTIKHNVFLTDRTKTSNRAVLNSIATINDAMSHRLNGKPHIPEKIGFKYLKHEINNIQDTVERRKGTEYIVSPFALVINDGNYYLLTYNEKRKQLAPYRVDRMRNVRLTGVPREGEEYFRTIDLKSYTQRVFGMYGGRQERVTIQFINPLLDTAVERFGTNCVQYAKVDDRHFKVTAEVQISEQFYGWLLGFGKRVKLLWPDDEVENLKEYLEKIQKQYLEETL